VIGSGWAIQEVPFDFVSVGAEPLNLNGGRRLPSSKKPPESSPADLETSKLSVSVPIQSVRPSLHPSQRLEEASQTLPDERRIRFPCRLVSCRASLGLLSLGALERHLDRTDQEDGRLASYRRACDV
jgi:hypothetical protein